MPSKPRPAAHAFFASTVIAAFEELDIGVNLFHNDDWLPLHGHAEPRLVSFELEHGAETERFAYNYRCLDGVRRRKRTLVAEHGGFSDLFVPVPQSERRPAVLVAGPLQRARPTSTDILERWHALTGQKGHLGDAEFSRYLAMSLSTLVLEGVQFTKFQRLLELFAELLASRGSAESIHAEIVSLCGDLRVARRVELTWDEARMFVDAHQHRILASRHSVQRLRALGLRRPPEQVAIGLLSNRDKDTDPVDGLVRRDAFQRACVELAGKVDQAVSGRIGDHGIMLLCGSTDRTSAERVRQRLIEFGKRASQLAERTFGLRLHLGLGLPSTALNQQYQDALGMAEAALTSGLRVATAKESTTADTSLARLRRELAALAAEAPKMLPLRFERYLEAVALRSGHRLEIVTLAAEAAFERVVDGALRSGALDEATLRLLAERLERAIASVATVGELLGVYRNVLGELQSEGAHPRGGTRDLSLRRAEEYIRQHYTESPSLGRVARVAGLSPKYFSTLFRKHYGSSFESHLLHLRLERAKQLLVATELNLQRIALLSGFSERHHFGTIFKRRVGQTPGQYRVRGKATVAGTRHSIRASV